MRYTLLYAIPWIACSSPLPDLVDVTTTGGVAVCGNGLVEPGEPCDDGNNNEFDDCLSTCEEARCGDGFLRADSEECDDNNQVTTDACTNGCTTARCGDGVVWTGVEACDDGNDVETDNCTTSCHQARCGDGHLQSGEACDDGNNVDIDSCRRNCEIARCGDGVIRKDLDADDADYEACDDGNTVDSDRCRNNCAEARCGDGVLQVRMEECDDGNESDDDECTSDCVDAMCGDGHVHLWVEECDDQNDDDTDACLTNCQRARCGDGIHRRDIADGGENYEACDDGNESNEDACLNSCDRNTAGDGFVRYDLNIGSEKKCSSNAQCGENGVCVDTGAESNRCITVGYEGCDDGDTDTDDSCLCLPNACRDDDDGRCGVCLRARCGDGLTLADPDPGEAAEDCDDGNTEDDDQCLSNCTAARCGDGIRRTDIRDENAPTYEACDDGNDNSADRCTNECTVARCGDGIRRLDLAEGQGGYEPCDDGEQNGTYLAPVRGDQGEQAQVARQDLMPCSEYLSDNGAISCRAYPDGSSAEKAAPSCLALQQVYGDALESGLYFIETRRLIPSRNEQERYRVRKRELYCDFDQWAAGRTGGWTECAKVRADGSVPRHFFESCSGLRVLDSQPTKALIKFFDETEDSTSGEPSFVVLVDGAAFTPGTRTRQTDNLRADATSEIDEGGGIDGIFRRPNVQEFQSNDWRFKRRDAQLLEFVQGNVPQQGFQPWLMVAKRKILELRVGGANGAVINTQPIDADLCIGCYGNCDDVAEANDRPLTWRGPKSALCISSSRFSDDGSFASKSQENFEFPRWQQTGALEIFVREDEHDQDQTP